MKTQIVSKSELRQRTCLFFDESGVLCAMIPGTIDADARSVLRNHAMRYDRDAKVWKGNGHDRYPEAVIRYFTKKGALVVYKAQADLPTEVGAELLADKLNLHRLIIADHGSYLEAFR